MQLKPHFTLTASMAALIIVLSATAESGGQSGALVRLQSATPGVSQTGHLNISGTGLFGNLRLPSGAADGRYLRSDASGNGVWTAFPTSLAPSGAAGGDLSGTYPNPTLATLGSSVAKVSGGGMFAANDGSFIGIGTTTPIGLARFVISQPTSNFGGMYINTETAGRPFYGYANGGAFSAYHYVDGSDLNKWKLHQGGSTRLIVQTDGKVGIGTNPQYQFDVDGNSTVTIHANQNGGGFGAVTTGIWGDSGGNYTNGINGSSSGDYVSGVVGTVAGTNNSAIAGYTYSVDSGSTGVYGGSATGAYAGRFDGRVQVTGLLSKGGGSFQIDHPLDPANKYLFHSFVESPDMMNIYNGVVTTDEKGYATVTMPSYFEALNRDFRYQLTVMGEGEWTLARVARKIQGNKFTIQTSQPNTEVSWQVTGIRQDNFANANRIEPEVMKEPKDRGRYLHPVEAGQPEESGILYQNRLRFPKPINKDK